MSWDRLPTLIRGKGNAGHDVVSLGGHFPTPGASAGPGPVHLPPGRAIRADPTGGAADQAAHPGHGPRGASKHGFFLTADGSEDTGHGDLPRSDRRASDCPRECIAPSPSPLNAPHPQPQAAPPRPRTPNGRSRTSLGTKSAPGPAGPSSAKP